MAASVKELLRRTKELLDAGDADAALGKCKEVLEKDKRNYHAWVFAGFAAKMKGEVSRAVKAYERAITIREDLPTAWRGLSEALAEPSELQVDGTEADPAWKRRAEVAQRLAQLIPEKKHEYLFAAATALENLGDDAQEEAIAAWEQCGDLEAQGRILRILQRKETSIDRQCRILERIEPEAWDRLCLEPVMVRNMFSMFMRHTVRARFDQMETSQEREKILQESCKFLPLAQRIGSVDLLTFFLEVLEEDDFDLVRVGSSVLEPERISQKILHLNPCIVQGSAESAASAWISFSLNASQGFTDDRSLMGINRSEVAVIRSNNSTSSVANRFFPDHTTITELLYQVWVCEQRKDWKLVLDFAKVIF
uniref:Uncharacterized protein n=1 Tax=Compsopogon caeruleus TaxID=31354 RepID=A0A7S1T6T6_9RHOD|mmetsp:Transcript_11382/g.23028  ORF Transcript_11382/g.23028 Transcript_11382/m.23028 type:complete len:366 (+) Transcript_11382:532-1629(+)